MKLSDKLIELRKEKGWSQEDFAEKLDVSRQAISRWENGTALPDAQNIVRISKLLNVTADYLLKENYEGDKEIPAVEAAVEKPMPLVQKKKLSYWCPIAVVCFVLLVACIVIGVVQHLNTPPGDVHLHHGLSSVKENELAPTCTTAVMQTKSPRGLLCLESRQREDTSQVSASPDITLYSIFFKSDENIIF